MIQKNNIKKGICKDCIRPCKIDTNGKYPICVCDFKETNKEKTKD
jgi:hypothetical protein